MPVAYIIDFPGGSVEEHDAVTEAMRLDGRLPAGALFHVAGPTAEGLRLIDVWESDDAYEAFAQADDPAGPTITGMDERRFERVEVQVRESGLPRSAITFAHVTRLPLDAAAFRELYQEVMERPGMPEGMVFHANGPAQDGGWIVVGAWTAREARDSMLADRVIPAARRLQMGPPTLEDLPVHSVLVPAGQPARA